MNKEKLKRIGKIAYNLVMYLFLAVCAVAIILTVTAKRREDGAADIFGYQIRTVITESMEKCEDTDVSDFRIKSIPKNSMILIQSVPEDPEEADKWYSELEVGDVLTFRYVYTTQLTITHRITSISEKEGGGYIIELAGDNKNSDSDQMYQRIDTSNESSPNYVIGKVVSKFVALGFIVNLLKNPMGIIFLVIIPCFIIILLEVLKIIGAYNENKLKRTEKEKAEKESELEELKRRLAALEKKEGEEYPEATARDKKQDDTDTVPVDSSEQPTDDATLREE